VEILLLSACGVNVLGGTLAMALHNVALMLRVLQAFETFFVVAQVALCVCVCVCVCVCAAPGSRSRVGRCGAVRCGVVRCGAVRCGAVRCGAVRCGRRRSTSYACATSPAGIGTSRCAPHQY
jgi:hypothetical protein